MKIYCDSKFVVSEIESLAFWYGTTNPASSSREHFHDLGLNKTGTSQVGAISKAQKAQNIFLEKKLEIFEKKNFFRKMSRSAKKCKRGTLFDL